jgi:hypothetical protein
MKRFAFAAALLEIRGDEVTIKFPPTTTSRSSRHRPM